MSYSRVRSKGSDYSYVSKEKQTSELKEGLSAELTELGNQFAEDKKVLDNRVYNAVEISDLQDALEDILGLSYRAGATAYESFSFLLTDRAYFTMNNGRGGYGEVVITDCQKQGDFITVTYDFHHYGSLEEQIERTSSDIVSGVAEFMKNDPGSSSPYQIISISN